jgi:hypothetical protein
MRKIGLGSQMGTWLQDRRADWPLVFDFDLSIYWL